jgi:hypothetical protein
MNLNFIRKIKYNLKNESREFKKTYFLLVDKFKQNIMPTIDLKYNKFIYIL